MSRWRSTAPARCGRCPIRMPQTRSLTGSAASASLRSTSPYAEALDAAIYAEAVRFDQAWRRREPRLLPIEREYAARKLGRAKALFPAGERYELLLALMELVEDAETLTARDQPEFPIKLLAFRDHLREVLGSPLYAEFKAGKAGLAGRAQGRLRHTSDRPRADL